MTALVGIEWRLVAYAGDDGDLRDVPPDVSASMRFEDTRVSGSSGCNRYAGGWSGSTDALRIGPLAGTMMACEDEAMAVEAAFLRRMAEVARAIAGGDRLDLLGADARVLLRFRASRVTLAGTTWHATGVNDGRGGVASLLEGTDITAELGEDGRIGGTAGCNRYGGTWSVDGEAIALGALAATRRMCPVPDGVMAQEQAYLAAMTRVTTWRLDGERLELRDGDGALQVAFRIG